VAANPISEIIAAFAAGCIDRDNYIQFKDYFAAGGELPDNELGDLQNIISMIPVILDLEQPNPAIKDNIAKKLISLKDEIKSRIREGKTTQTFENKPTFTESKTVTGKTFVSEPEEGTAPETKQAAEQTLNFLKPKQSTKLTRGEFINTSIDELRKRGSTRIESIIPEQPQTLFPGPQQPVVQPQPQEKAAGGFAGWLAVILTLLLFTILGYYTYVSLSETNSKIEELEHSITSIKSEMAASNNFINNYISLIEFFNNRDIVVVNLTTGNAIDKAAARIFLAFDQKEGLIQFKNTRPLQPNQGLQVWAVSKNQSYSLGVYTPNLNEYIRLSSFPFLPKEQIEKIRITVESNTGSPTPSVQTYLEGSFIVPK
jgi:hypothetical protein